MSSWRLKYGIVLLLLETLAYTMILSFLIENNVSPYLVFAYIIVATIVFLVSLTVLFRDKHQNEPKAILL